MSRLTRKTVRRAETLVAWLLAIGLVALVAIGAAAVLIYVGVVP